MKREVEKVSVVMCTYNGERYLREQLDSIVNQTYPIYELIVQDDCSSDSTVNIVNEYKKEYPYIKLFQNVKNIGFNANFWSAFEKATGDYVAISDQDDIWMNTKIEKLVDGIGCNLLIYSDSIPFVDEVPDFGRDVAGKSALTDMRFITLQAGVCGHDCLISKSLLALVPESLKEHLVYDFCLALVAKCEGKIIHKSENLTYFRRHPKASSNLLLNSEKGISGYIEGFRSLNNANNRKEIAYIYQLSLPYLRNHPKRVRLYAYFLSSGKRLFVFLACFISFLYGNQIRLDYHTLMGKVRSFFIPIFVFGKWKYIKTLWNF